ncbi:hypothetical protein ANN_24521 [Periplaneta americana]|uniref:Uncharacterized protein n=1 Tax=Periplaneta americana TaxID=6978 RepID=A0ABQ8S397_PERAM|nr:hypothetical protein ANN_24521 [Periplaneta americana]
MAGEDWFNLIMKHHPELSIGKPEGLSRARATGMNKENVQQFYFQLEKLVKECILEERPECIYTQDETGLLLNKRPNVIAKKGAQDILSRTSVERATVGTAVTEFESTGIYPLNPNAVPEAKFLLSKTANSHPNETEIPTSDQVPSASTEMRTLLSSPKKSESPKRQRPQTNSHVTLPENLNLLREKQKSKNLTQGKTAGNASKRMRLAAFSTDAASPGSTTTGVASSSSTTSKAAISRATATSISTTTIGTTTVLVRQKDEDICNFCGLRYSDPKNTKMGSWIQCQKCNRWYH